jgi:ACS family glucarate transporter-like MFS transporter
MNERATRVRYMVLAFACALSMITYLDRACFGAVALTLAKELSLNSVAELKWAFTAFAISYAVFEIPTGWLGDVWGPRRTLLRIVIWWSVCTALTGLVGLKFGSYAVAGLGTLIVLRFLFGAGEAGAYPNITRALHNWFPTDQAATAQGWIWMSGRLMAGVTPMIWTFLVVGTDWTAPLITWRGAFALFGLLGVVWCGFFAWFFRDHPRDHSWVNAAEQREIERGHVTAEAPGMSLPVRSFLRSRNLWLLCVMYFCMVYGWFFNITYYPSHLQERFQLDPGRLLTAVYQGGPLWMGAIGCLTGGWFVDWMIRRTGDRRRTRRLVGMTAELLGALGWIAAIFAPNALCFFLAVSLAAMCNDLTVASAWATCQDIGQRYTAVTAACMNTIGTLGAVAAGWLTGAIVEYALSSRAATLGISVNDLSTNDKYTAQISGYDFSFMTYAAAYLISAICWRFIDSTKPIVDSAKPEIAT